MAKTYKITEVCGDWALHIPPYGKTDAEMILIFNSRNNAELVKSVLEWEDAHPNAAVPYKSTLAPPNEPKGDGLYGKYTVYKNKDGSLVTDCFILRPAKDPAAVAALRAYAATTDNAELASDIINWVGAEPNEPLTQEQLREMVGHWVWVLVNYEHNGEAFQCDGWALVATPCRIAYLDQEFPVSELGTRFQAYTQPVSDFRVRFMNNREGTAVDEKSE